MKSSLFIVRIIIYLICFVVSLFGLQAFDFNRFIKKNKVIEARVLYFIIAICLAYMLGQFIISITYYLN